MLSTIIAVIITSFVEGDQIPHNRYCANVYGRFVSKLVATPAGTASINLSGKTTTVTVQTDSHTVDAATGVINFNRKGLQYDAQTFPFIRHLWDMKYDTAKSELQLVSPVTEGYIHFEAGCSVSKRAAPELGSRSRKLAGNTFGNVAFCSSPSQEDQGIHAKFHFYSSGLEATMVYDDVTVALFSLEYNRETADSDSNEEIRVSFPSPSEYPYLEYNFKLKYGSKTDTLEMSGTADGGSASLTLSSC